MNSSIRTDLALEEGRSFRESSGVDSIPGVECTERRRGGMLLTSLEILDRRGEAALGKPRGRYLTLEPEALLRREHSAFGEACEVLAEELRGFINLPYSTTVLVVGLGNRYITPDAVGPLTVDSVMVTRHLRSHLPHYFASLRPVCAVKSGVLGTTGIESSDIVSALCRHIRPDAVVAIDALASRSLSGLCRTVQLTDTGIVPGSGVGNARAALNRESLGLPVIAIGVPTVVDAPAIARELCGDRESFGSESESMIVTPRDIDKKVADISKLLAYSLNLALHEGIGIEDIDMFLS